LILHTTVLFISPEAIRQFKEVKLIVPSNPGKTEPLGGSKWLEVTKPEYEMNGII
jgi:hypothetical protein